MKLKDLALRSILLSGLLLTGAVDFSAHALPQALNTMDSHPCGEQTDFSQGPAHLDLIVSTEVGDQVQTLYFAPTSVELSDAARMILQELANELQSFGTISIQLYQSTDTSGGLLFQDRVVAVEEELAQIGFETDALESDTPRLLTAEL